MLHGVAVQELGGADDAVYEGLVHLAHHRRSVSCWGLGQVLCVMLGVTLFVCCALRYVCACYALCVVPGAVLVVCCVLCQALCYVRS